MNRAAALVACALLGGCAAAAGGVAPGAPEAGGYLAGTALDALAAGVSPPPAEDPAKARFDVLPGSDRWWLAVVHAELRPPHAAQHFDCVTGALLAGRPRPALTRLMDRLLIDAGSLGERVARQGPRPRPIAVVAGLQPCQTITPEVRGGSAWPANGALAGAVYGELFADLAPDRADAARRIGREIGISRAVCRMNWEADVAAGRTLGEALYRRAAGAPEFAADLRAARAEVDAARAEGLSNPGCAAERRALGIRPAAG